MTHSSPGGSGKIITFYSYKGGTGRTMALANVAWIIASSGYRVLAVDWDLESPGLHKYFHPFLQDKNLRSSPGVIDMVRDYAEAVMHPLGSGEDEDWIAPFADVLRYAVSLDWPFTGSPGQPTYLEFLPAGRQDAAYTKAVSTFDWLTFYERLGGNAFLDALIRSMRENYDYVLIDSRTGVSDSAGTCTIRLPDTVVVSFTMNDQSIDGAVAVARSIRRQRTDQPVELLPVPMRVEDAEQLKLEAGRDYARRRFTPFLPAGAADDVDRYWGDIEIPYKPFYAYEEILAPFGDRPQQEGSLLTAYERLARTITGGDVPHMPKLEEPLRRRWLAAFERPRAAAAVDVLISYVAIDRMWAEWISGELSDAGLQTTMREIDFPTRLGDGADPLGKLIGPATRVVVLLSQDYVLSANAAELWKQAVDRNPVNTDEFLVPIRLDNVRGPMPFSELIPVDLAGLNETRATEVLRTAFGLPEVPRPAESDVDTPHARRRFPGTEPPVWRVPSRNPTFTGRRALLEDIRNRLSVAAGTPVAPQALHGLGGVGKSQVAMEYAHRFRADYDVVWWVSSQQVSVVRATLAALAEHLTPAPPDAVDDPVRAALDMLRRGQPYHRWLLIFDNADDPVDLREFLPQGPGHVLITTRNQAWAREASVVEVPVFNRVESIAFLSRRAPHLSETDADLVADRLGDLPLAIEQAGAWLAETGQPVDQYLDQLEQQLPEMLAEELPADYQQSGAQPWLLSLQSLRERSPAAAKVLEVCAFFADEPVPMSLIYGDRFVEVLLPYDPSLRDPVLMGRAIREIGRYALARIDVGRPIRGDRRRRSTDRADEVGQTSFQLHRLVQAVIRASLPAEEAAQNRRHVHAILAAANPKDPDQPDNWPLYTDLWPHILPSRTLTSDQPEVRQLLLDLARYMWNRADYTTCRELAERTLTVWEDQFGTDDPQTQLMRFHLANALRLQANYRAAYEIDVDVYERLSRRLSTDHPYTLMAAGSLAGDLRALGEFVRARDLDQRTEAMAREVFGEDNQRALIAAHNLALSMRLVGDLRAALDLDDAILRRRQIVFGDRHPYTLATAANYGRDLRDTGDLRESRRVLESLVDDHRAVFGEDHPDTLRVIKNFAVTLRKLGEFATAHALNLDTLARTLRLHRGQDHPDVQACAMNLACDESALGQDAGALRRARPVYEWYRREMGEDHMFTLAYANNLSVFQRKVGDVDPAYELIAQVVARFTALAGSEHPYTLAAQINLGNCLYDREDYAAALANDQLEYERFRRILGAPHPDTLAAGSNLASSLAATGDPAEAGLLLDSLMPLYERVLGADHPNTRAAAEGKRLNCDLEPPPT